MGKVLSLLLLSLLLLTACATAVPIPTPPAEIGTAIDPPQWMPDFTLTDQNFKATNLSDLRGRPTLLAFAYTHCPDICPLTVADFKRVKAALPTQNADVNFVMISVDGLRDTPEVLKKYLGNFDPQFIGLTGAPSIVAQIASDFGAKFRAEQPSAGGAYAVSHSTYIYLIDQHGRWRKTYAFATAPDAMAEDIKRILAEPAPEVDKSESFSVAYARPKLRAIYMDNPAPIVADGLWSVDGNKFDLKSLVGKPTLLFFGATECLDTDECQELTKRFATTREMLGSEATGVNFVVISVDGERDTPARLQDFMQVHNQALIALSGPISITAPLAIKHGVHVEIRSGANVRAIPHPAYSMLLDKRGNWVVALPIRLPVEDIVAEVRKQLR